MLAIAVGQLAFLLTAALMNGYGEKFFESVTGPMVGHIQIHAPEWRENRSIDLTIGDLETTLEALRSDPGIDRASPRVFCPVLAALSEEGLTGIVVGVEPETEFHEMGLLSGQDPAGHLGDHRVLVGYGFARKHDIEPGMELALVGQDIDGSIANDLYTVSGIVFTPVDVVNNLGLVMSLEDAQEFLRLEDAAHEIVIHATQPDDLISTRERLAVLPALRGMEVLVWQDVVPQLVGMIGMMDWYALIILIIVFIAAAAGIANTMLMSTFERTHEFGMLLSLGCGPSRLSRMILVEAVFLGLIGVAAGTVVGLGFVLATSGTGIDYAALGGSDQSYDVAFGGLHLSSHVYPRIRALDILAGVSAVLLTSFVSVIWPVLHISRLEPMEALRQ